MRRDRASDRRDHAWPIVSRSLRVMRVEIPRLRLMQAFACGYEGCGRSGRFVLTCPSQRKMSPEIALRIGGLKRLPVKRMAAEQDRG